MAKSFRDQVSEAVRPDPIELAKQIDRFQIMPAVLVDAEWEEGESEVYKGIRTTEWSTVSPITGNEVVVTEIENASGGVSYSYDTSERMCGSFEEAATVALRRDLDGAMRRPDPTPEQLARELAEGVSLAAAAVGRDVYKILAMAKSIAEMTGRQDARYWNFRCFTPYEVDSSARKPGETPCFLVGADAGNGWRSVCLAEFPQRIACYCPQEEGHPAGDRCLNAPPIPVGDPVYRYIGVRRQPYQPYGTTCLSARENSEQYKRAAMFEEDPAIAREHLINSEIALSTAKTCICRNADGVCDNGMED